MNHKSTLARSRAVLAAALPVAVAFLGAGRLHSQSTTIKIDGSSTVFPVSQAVAEEFKADSKGKTELTVGFHGTGGGFKKFARGEIDICDASRPIKKEEMKACKEAGIEYIELPICFDALTVAVHPANNWASSITVDELKKIWEPAAQGKITHWNQIRSDWPNEKLALFAPGSDSGTFDYFTEAICGKSAASRGDYTASEDDNILVRGIEGNKYSLGYIPYAYFEPNKKRMKAVAVQWDKNSVKTPVMPSMENVLEGTYNPLSRPLFIYVSKAAAERPEVAAFVDYYLTHVAELAKEVKYLPLPAAAYEICQQRFKKRETGTAYAGAPAVGVKVEDILKRKLVHDVPDEEGKAAPTPAAGRK